MTKSTTNPIVRPITYALIILTCLLSGCSTEDDLNEIFIGNTFHITNLTYNSTTISKDLTELYESGNEAYYIVFNNQTFQGTLRKGTHIEGTWHADGKNNRFSMKFGSSTSLPVRSDIQDKIYDILLNAQSYSGDSNVLKIYKDSSSFITLSSRKLN